MSKIKKITLSLTILSLSFATAKNNDFRDFKEKQRVKLLEAIESNRIDKIKEILANGANINAPGEEGITPLLGAIGFNNLELVKLLIDLGADVNFISEIKKENIQCTPLYLAILIGNKDIVESLLKAGADVNIQGGVKGQLFPPLSIAISSAIARKDKDITQSDKEILRLLLIDKKIDINFMVKDITPLFLATKFNEEDIVKLLIDHGADINKQCTILCITPLQEAVNRKNKKIIKLLLDAKADINMESDTSFSAIDLAYRSKDNEIIKLFGDAKALSEK